MKAVIDSSTLISFAKISALDLVEKADLTYHCPFEVYQETVVEGLNAGYTDAALIKRIFDRKKIEISKVSEGERDLPKTDLIILSLCKKLNAFLLTNDVKLARRAEFKNIKVWGSADMLLSLYRQKKVNKKIYHQKIRSLYTEGRISKGNMEFYLVEEK